jgi:hypothetical protein
LGWLFDSLLLPLREFWQQQAGLFFGFLLGAGRHMAYADPCRT